MQLIGHEPFLPWMVLFEFARGHYYRGRTEEEMRAFLSRFTLLPATEAQVLRAARVAAELQLKDLTPGTGDVWIAAAALEENIPVLTANPDHFEPIEGVFPSFHNLDDVMLVLQPLSNDYGEVGFIFYY